ncbi:MAG TPA: inositol monophosphatase family protein [Kiritimatiellia bacterium]|nr:inositol monophosphatase family protein [Kiritimatiellia bacterium]HMO98761.1 inositol monophosphatase family protein [Kiritimatiellia bacterium]HMP95937.1 inositol monophosphatase family protein [Kiritimatiellia bacterium]
MSSREPSAGWWVERCREAVIAAGEHAVRHRPRHQEVHTRYAHDIKLALDHECQEVAVEAIRRHAPDAHVVGEEGTVASAGADGVEWIVDPIDGTVNFFHGLTWWCSSVAVRVDGVIQAGAVYAPEAGLLFDADRFGPARLNERIVRGGGVERLADALAITGSEKELEPGVPPLHAAQTLAPHVQKIRILGAAAIDLCQVASGAADLFFQNGLYLWDIAAAGLIIERAGGCYRQMPSGLPGRYRVLAAGHPAVADAAGALLNWR